MNGLRHLACTGTTLVALLAIAAFCCLVADRQVCRADDAPVTVACAALGARSALYLGELK
jgi:hypothetical protein